MPFELEELELEELELDELEALELLEELELEELEELELLPPSGPLQPNRQATAQIINMRVVSTIGCMGFSAKC